MLRIVRTGVWLYAGSVDRDVDVVALDYDFWHAVAKADGTLDESDAPTPLDASGWLYYCRFAHAGEPNEPTWVDGSSHPTIESAMAEAQAHAPSTIRWL